MLARVFQSFLSYLLKRFFHVTLLSVVLFEVFGLNAKKNGQFGLQFEF